jgi:hypothetical protein
MGEELRKYQTTEERLADVIAERDRLLTLCDAVGAESIADIVAERDRLRAVVDAADDFWPLIESIYDGALAAWEYGDPRMKYVTVQISKVDLPTLRAAYVSPTGEDT